MKTSFARASLRAGWGIAAAATAAGAALLIGAAIPRAATAGAGPNASCTSSNPCIMETNNGTGNGLEGVSLNRNGVAGVTKFASTSTTNFHAGIFGLDSSHTGTFDAGVWGKSASGDGGLFQSDGSGNGIIATAINGEGIGTLSTNGIGGRFIGPNFVGVDAEGGFNQGDGTIYPALSVVGESSVNGPPDLIDACPVGVGDPCQSLFSVLALDQSGNLTIAGQIFTTGSCSTGCAAGPGGTRKRVLSYAPKETVPTMEDFGEAQLVRGQAYVPLGRDFANVIDRGATYLVFITPEGDNRGLYVTGKTAAGFAVRESMGGRSSIAFQYRIVAKPIGSAAARLPMIQTRVGRGPVVSNAAELRR